MAMRHGGGEERRNVSRSAVESGEAVCETKRRQPLPEGAFHRAGSAAVSTAENVPLNRADERPLIAVSAGNFNTALLLQDRFSNPVDLKVVASFLSGLLPAAKRLPPR